MSESRYAATLVRGTTYVVANRSGGDDYVFVRDTPVVINQNLHDILTDVVDEVAGGTDLDTGEVEFIVKPMFQIEAYDGECAVGTSAKPVETVKPSRRIRKAA